MTVSPMTRVGISRSGDSCRICSMRSAIASSAWGDTGRFSQARRSPPSTLLRSYGSRRSSFLTTISAISSMRS
jgi:hypothetical protein